MAGVLEGVLSSPIEVAADAAEYGNAVVAVVYHGSIAEAAGTYALLLGFDPRMDGRYVLDTDEGLLFQVREESFTLL